MVMAAVHSPLQPSHFGAPRTAVMRSFSSLTSWEITVTTISRSLLEAHSHIHQIRQFIAQTATYARRQFTQGLFRTMVAAES